MEKSSKNTSEPRETNVLQRSSADEIISQVKASNLNWAAGDSAAIDRISTLRGVPSLREFFTAFSRLSDASGSVVIEFATIQSDAEIVPPFVIGRQDGFDIVVADHEGRVVVHHAGVRSGDDNFGSYENIWAFIESDLLG
jgi:hypothetical protein